jgi:hypothetical protein
MSPESFQRASLPLDPGHRGLSRRAARDKASLSFLVPASLPPSQSVVYDVDADGGIKLETIQEQE